MNTDAKILNKIPANRAGSVCRALKSNPITAKKNVLANQIQLLIIKIIHHDQAVSGAHG
jgi:hypothetical protein